LTLDAEWLLAALSGLLLAGVTRASVLGAAAPLPYHPPARVAAKAAVCQGRGSNAYVA
jgi:hypothetical protein